MSLEGEAISKMAEEAAAGLKPDKEDVRILGKQRNKDAHVTLLGVHRTVESAKGQAQARANVTTEIIDKDLGWAEDQTGRWQSRLLDVGNGEQIKYFILPSLLFDPSYYPRWEA